MPVVIDQASGKTTVFDTPEETPAPPVGDDGIQEVTVRASFPWGFWLTVGALAALAWYASSRD